MRGRSPRAAANSFVACTATGSKSAEKLTCFCAANSPFRPSETHLSEVPLPEFTRKHDFLSVLLRISRPASNLIRSEEQRKNTKLRRFPAAAIHNVGVGKPGERLVAKLLALCVMIRGSEKRRLTGRGIQILDSHRGSPARSGLSLVLISARLVPVFSRWHAACNL